MQCTVLEYRNKVPWDHPLDLLLLQNDEPYQQVQHQCMGISLVDTFQKVPDPMPTLGEFSLGDWNWDY
jgi:hypothetical protein